MESYDTDKLNHHGGLSVAFAMQLVGAARLVERAIPTVTWPFLLLHGDADKLCNISGSYMMLEKAQSIDKQLKVVCDCLNQTCAQTHTHMHTCKHQRQRKISPVTYDRSLTLGKPQGLCGYVCVCICFFLWRHIAMAAGSVWWWLTLADT